MSVWEDEKDENDENDGNDENDENDTDGFLPQVWLDDRELENDS